LRRDVDGIDIAISQPVNIEYKSDWPDARTSLQQSCSLESRDVFRRLAILIDNGNSVRNRSTR
jgi:hypothetical protein